MILLFPSLEILRLALTSATVPAEVQSLPAQAVLTDAGAVFVAPASPLSQEAVDALQRLGVSGSPALPAGKTLRARCWLQVVPVERTPGVAQTPEKGAAVLFRINTPDRFASLAAEMLRLGNDRQSFRHVHDGSREWTLLRVMDPPYYSLLSAIERGAGELQVGAHADTGKHTSSQPAIDREEPAVVAYIEQAPRVWVQLGYRHPLAERIVPPAGQFLLMQPPHAWQLVDEGAFHDVYQALELQLPSDPQRWTERPQNRKIQIPIRLAEGNLSAVPELWVLRDRATEQIEELIVRSDDELIARLAFAVIEMADGPTVVLRTRPSRQTPPVLVLDALACCTYLKLPNLFVPVGRRLNPPLRRDAVSKLLSNDNRQLTWLQPQSNGRFIPMSIQDSAFRPLSDWVDYIVDHQRQPLAAWIQSHQFDFESFVCRDDAPRPAQATPDRHARGAGTDKPPTVAESKPAHSSERKPLPSSEAKVLIDTASTDAAAIKTAPSVLAERLQALEQHFLESKEAFDSPQRQDVWRKMGVLNSHLKHRTDTTVCWCNGLWNQTVAEPQTVREWLLSELRSSGRARADIQCVDEVLRNPEAVSKDASLIGAYLIHALASGKGVGDLKRRAAALVQFFQKQERYLPVRTVWMIALAVHQLTDGDTLGLARTRDRILERLFEQGLQAEFDIAGFLRGGSGNNDRRRTLRSQFSRLTAAIDRWVIEPASSALAKNRVYARLICAYGFASMGEVVTCRGIVAQAVEDLQVDPIHRWMGHAFAYRIEQMAKGTDDRGTLPDAMLSQLENMERLTRYKVDRLRQQSRILEPYERIDPYRRWHKRYRDELYQALAELQDVTDRDKLLHGLEHMLDLHRQGERGIRVTAAALELAPRLGEKFGSQLLQRVDGLVGQCDDAIEKALLLQRAIYVAAHFGHLGAVQALVERLSDALPSIVAEYLTLQPQYNPGHKERIDTVEALLQDSFRGLRKLGMRDEIAVLYSRIADQVRAPRARGKSAPQSTSADPSVPRRLRLLLCVASGWYYFGKVDEAHDAAERVRTVLLAGELSSVDQRSLAVAYVQTVAQAPIDEALRRIQEMFAVRASGQRALPKIEDNMTTSTHFSVVQMELVEAGILSLLGDEASPGAASQRWLDEDEFAIRKRIHADMKRALG